MKRETCFYFLLVFFICVPFLAQAEGGRLSGHEIMVKVHDRPDGDNRKTLMSMTLINKRGRTRERTVLSYAMDIGKDSKNLMFFQKPADVKGVAFLSWEYDDPSKDDDRWLYMPALKKVKRISGSSKNDYFMGTDFTYDDMGGRSIDEDDHKLLREEKPEGFDCWVVESKPVKTKDQMYSRRISWIRKDSLTPVKVEYYDRQGSLLKILIVPDIREKNGFWTMFRMEMENKQEKHRTVLEIEEIEYNLDIKESMFKVSTLERGVR